MAFKTKIFALLLEKKYTYTQQFKTANKFIFMSRYLEKET